MWDDKNGKYKGRSINSRTASTTTVKSQLSDSYVTFQRYCPRSSLQCSHCFCKSAETRSIKFLKFLLFTVCHSSKILRQQLSK